MNDSILNWVYGGSHIHGFHGCFEVFSVLFEVYCSFHAPVSNWYLRWVVQKKILKIFQVNARFNSTQLFLLTRITNSSSYFSLFFCLSYWTILNVIILTHKLITQSGFYMFVLMHTDTGKTRKTLVKFYNPPTLPFICMNILHNAIQLPIYLPCHLKFQLSNKNLSYHNYTIHIFS